MLKPAVPFEVELTPALITYLPSATGRRHCQATRIVSQISYAGDEGGIVCHIVPKEGRNALIVSLTHVRAHRSLPFAPAVFDYQRRLFLCHNSGRSYVSLIELDFHDG